MFKFLVLEKSIAPIQAPAAQNSPNFVEQLGEQVQLLPFTPQDPSGVQAPAASAYRRGKHNPGFPGRAWISPLTCHAIPFQLL